MKQIGNLAIVCAKRPEVLMQIYNGQVSVHTGEGPGREQMSADWTDDVAVSKMIYELNYGRYAVSENSGSEDSERKTA